MTPEILTAIKNCAWAPSPNLLFSENVYGPLIYYSHFLAFAPALFLGAFLFLSGRKHLSNILLFLVTLVFSTWIFADLVLWTSAIPSYVMFFWAVEIITEPFIYFFSFYFFYTFAFRRDLPLTQKILFVIPLIPTLLFAPTTYALLGFDLSNCDRAAVEGPLASYGYLIEFLYTISIVISAIIAIKTSEKGAARKKILLLSLGVVAFLLSFSIGNIVEVFTENWSIGQYGLIGAPIFVAFLTFLIVRYQEFNARLIGAQVLVLSLGMLIASMLFVRDGENIKVIISLTLILLWFLGTMLVRGVKKEIEAREHIEKLAEELKTANEQQSVLIHFVTHQIKGFFTMSRNIFSLMLENTFGELNPGMKKMVQQGFDNTTKGVSTVQEILNAANLKKGTVQMKMISFDARALVDEILAELKPRVDEKKLQMSTVLSSGPLVVVGDRFQLHEVYKNLVDNAIRYTPQGKITVTLEKQSNAVHFSVTDSGVGLSEDDKKRLFTEGGRGKDSLKVNVDSTGFGLFIAKGIVDAHKGHIWAESEGPGKGSTFAVELPLVA